MNLKSVIPCLIYIHAVSGHGFFQSTNLNSYIQSLRGGGGHTKYREFDFKYVQEKIKTKILNVNNNQRHLPFIQAVLIPRKVSIPRVIRLISAFIFTASFLECLRTAGDPFRDVVRSILYPQKNENNAKWKESLSVLDIYVAKKIASAKNDVLPSQYIPSGMPFLGLIFSMFVMNIGLTMLLPTWIIGWNVWMKYIRIDHGQRLENDDVELIETYLQRGEEESPFDEYYQSFMLNRDPLQRLQNQSDVWNTGLDVLVEIPERDKEISDRSLSKTQIVSLFRSSCNSTMDDEHPTPYYFNLGQRRYYVHLDLENSILRGNCVDGGPDFYKEETISQLISRRTQGLSDPKDLIYAESRYGAYNDLSIHIPTVQDVFIARITSPLAVFQIIGRLLSILEDDFLPTVVNMMNTFGQHYMSARKSIVSVKELSNEVQGSVQNTSEQEFLTLRPTTLDNFDYFTPKWVQVPASELLPGDVFYLPHERILMPVDAMLLEGECLTQEAAITGESVPQIKISVHNLSDDDAYLSMESKHRSSILFAGTKVLRCVDSETIDNVPINMKSSAKCLVLKTGAYSSKGEIVRAITKNSSEKGRITNEEKDRDSLRLIFALTAFSIVACIILLVPTSQSSINVSGFRRIIQCTRILIASIPSDLPLALSAIIQSCTLQLKRESDVVCAEPGSLLSAAHVNLCVFDKTGTITADTQVMTAVVSPYSDHIHPMADAVLAGCHSLSYLNDGNISTFQLVGDPLDQAALQFSQFKFNSTDNNAIRISNWNQNKTTSHKASAMDPIQIWQIKTFPFDSTARRSSAIVLIKHADSKYKLWKLCKGSPDSMKSLLSIARNDDDMKRYDDCCDQLGSEGARVVTLSVQDVSNTKLMNALFPQGISGVTVSVTKKIKNARAIAQNHMNRNMFDDGTSENMEFVGFGCFSASLRPSSPRVIKEIRASGTGALMLTGDGASAAIAIGRNANFFDRSCKKYAALDVSKENKLFWTILKGKKMSKRSTTSFNGKNTDDILKLQKLGKCAIMMSGASVDVLLYSSELKDDTRYVMLKNMDKVTIISRASPETKQSVLGALKTNCKCNVLMSGDGLNDISAMKTADISAALLNGFGRESISTFDDENQRRLTLLKSNKSKSTGFRFDNSERIKRKLNEALNNRDSNASAFLDVIKSEFKRGRALQKGGAEAARILREETLKNSLMEKSSIASRDEFEDICLIKPGEASLAAAFTLLRPCIDGVDAIIRKGVVAAAYSLSTYRSIALNSLMACYNLATLYRDGFRYGKYMWNVELMLILAMEKGQSDLSNISRPRIPQLRPQKSIFHPSIALSVFLQACIHVYVLTIGTRAARFSQMRHGEPSSRMHLRVASTNLLSPYKDVLSNIQTEHQVSFLGRRPFRPNAVTNTVFILSIFQNTMISIFNHTGAPFMGSLLESKTFCIWSSVSILFSICMVLEVQPAINTILQLEPFRSKEFQLILLSLMSFDFLACYLAENLTLRLLDEDLWNAKRQIVQNNKPSELAADHEEQMLYDLRARNISFAKFMSVASLIYIIRTMLKLNLFGFS